MRRADGDVARRIEILSEEEAEVVARAFRDGVEQGAGRHREQLEEPLGGNTATDLDATTLIVPTFRRTENGTPSTSSNRIVFTFPGEEISD